MKDWFTIIIIFVCVVSGLAFSYAIGRYSVLHACDTFHLAQDGEKMYYCIDVKEQLSDNQKGVY